MSNSLKILVIIILFGLIIKYSCAHNELDDVHHLIPMSRENFERQKWLWVIPLYLGIPLSENKEWCETIKNSGKMLGMHGVQHTFDEFAEDVDEEYIRRGMEEFKTAFGYYPRYFKAPRLNLTPHNKKLIEKLGMKIKGYLNQYFNIVYHTEDYGRKYLGRLIGELDVD